MKKIIGITLGLGFALSAQASIVVHGSTTAFQETGGDWLSKTTNDIDMIAGYGTDGYYFAGAEIPPGVFNGERNNNSGSFDAEGVPASYISSFTAGASVVGTAYGNSADGFGVLDDPLLLDGTDATGGFWISTGGTAGDTLENVKFTVGPLAAGQTVRVGVISGMQQEDNGRWEATSITLSNGTFSATVGDHNGTQLVSNPGGIEANAGWVFFDIDAAGDYTLSGTKRLNTQGLGFSGVTFDSFQDGAALRLLPRALSLELDAPDTFTNGMIQASYVAGMVTSNDIDVISVTASNGFSASPVVDLGTGNLTEDITVTFTNSVGLTNGETTNSTLVVTWTELGSGVTNTSVAELDVTFINEPSSLALLPTSLSLALNDPDMVTSDTIVASFVEGSLSANVEVISLDADAGFSGTPGSFILSTANTNEDITVSFDNSSIGLTNGETTNSTLVVTWTEAGSSITNTSEVALDVTYFNEPSSLALAPTSLTLILNDPETVTSDTIEASFVEGTHGTDVEVVSVVAADSDFLAAPDSFTLSAASPYEDITVTYTNSGDLEDDGDTASSTLVVTWTESGSGVTNTSEAALNVTYAVALEGIIFEATTNNTTLVGNRNPIVGSLTGTPGALQINNTGGNFDMVGFASTDTINTMNETALTVDDTVTFKATITGITGSIRANGVEFGMNPSTTFRATSNLIYAVKAQNAFHAISGNAFQDAGNLAGKSSEASMKDGFDIKLVANAEGYTFTINGIVNGADGGATTIIESGTFAGNEFLDNFSDGHFYLAVQQYNTDAVMSISEAVIAVQSGAAIQPVIMGTSVSDGNFNLTFAGTVGKEYEVESTVNLTIDSLWKPVTNFTALPETPMTVSWPTTNNAVFYRISTP